MIDFGRTISSDPELSSQHEWLVTNGIGGYASGAVGGMLTRRYHGLLIAALQPPLGQTLLVAKFDETAHYTGREYALASNIWLNGVIDPKGVLNLERFYLEGSTPVWQYACADALLEKHIWMEYGANITYVHYTLVRSSEPCKLSIKVLVNYRNHHHLTRVTSWGMQSERIEGGLRVIACEGAAPIYLKSDRGTIEPQHMWYRGYYLPAEEYRGLDHQEDHLLIGAFHATLAPGESLTVALSAGVDMKPDGAAALARRRKHDATLLQAAGETKDTVSTPLTPVQQLILAADQFIVARAAPDVPDGRTVIAGYPWFTDWGRDTMIALPGLTLATGRPEIAACILRTFAHYVDKGMLPNRFPDIGEAPEYNTVDATLWYFEAIRAYIDHTGDLALLRKLFPTLAEIVAWHVRGTRYNIHVDPEDSLLYAGDGSVQLTWMDAKVGDWVVTPRHGKPVEVNALWCNALEIMANFARRLEQPDDQYVTLAAAVRKGFARFWNNSERGCFDVLDGPNGHDPSLRPNQLLAVSLPYSPLSRAQQRVVVDVCARHLLTSHGLRTLAPDEPAYVGRYSGNVPSRDSAYHQGTVWAWLMGPFVTAHLRVYQDPVQARSLLMPLLCHVASHGVGSISEIFDGDPPFTPRGCFAQAWSVAEVLRAWRLTTLHATPGVASTDQSSQDARS